MDKDLLDRVVEKLYPMSTLELRIIAMHSEVSYDTVTRIAWLSPDRYDPGYSKVRKLGAFLFKTRKAKA